MTPPYPFGQCRASVRATAPRCAAPSARSLLLTQRAPARRRDAVIAPPATEPPPPTWAPAATADDPPRHDDVHRRRPVHRQLRLHRRRRQRLRRVRRALRRPRRGHRHQRLPQRVAAARHPGHLQRGRQPDQRGHPGRAPAPSSTPPGTPWTSVGTTDANTCAYNDFALVKVNAADDGKVNPSIPFWGGPTGIDTNGTAAGDRGLHLRQLQPARRRRGALAADRHQPRRQRGRRRLDAPALHRDPGRPR